jgi:hypothetical protein
VTTSTIQINPNGEELRPEQADCPRISRAAWQLIRKPALAFAGIVVGKEMSSARVPAESEPLTQFQTYMRVMFNVADVSRLHTMLCHNPEFPSDMPIPYWSAPWLPSLSSFRFEQRISGQRQTQRKRQLDWRVQKIFLKSVNDSVLHFVMTLPLLGQLSS